MKQTDWARDEEEFRRDERVRLVAEMMDPPPVWWKASRSAVGPECVEVATGPAGSVLIRDSKDPDGPWLRVTRATWAAFLRRVKRS